MTESQIDRISGLFFSPQFGLFWGNILSQYTEGQYNLNHTETTYFCPNRPKDPKWPNKEIRPLRALKFWTERLRDFVPAPTPPLLFPAILNLNFSLT